MLRRRAITNKLPTLRKAMIPVQNYLRKNINGTTSSYRDFFFFFFFFKILVSDSCVLDSPYSELTIMLICEN